MITANRSRSLALDNWWRGQPTATAQGRGRSAEVPAPGFEPSGWAANPRDPHPHPGRAAQRAEGCLQGASPVDSVFSATRLCPAAAPRCALGRASALLGPYCRTGEGGAAPPLNDPASPAPTPPETSVCLVPPDLRFLTPDQRRGVSARPTQPRGGVRPPPDQSASLAAATSRLHRALSRGLPERQAGRLPARPIEGPQVDRSACGGKRGLPGVPSLHNQGPTPLLKKQVGRSQANWWAVMRLFRSSKQPLVPGGRVA